MSAAPHRFSPRTDVPWQFVRELWQAGIGDRQLSQMFGVFHTTISSRAQREGWKRPKPAKQVKPHLLSNADPPEFARLSLERNCKRAIRAVNRMSDAQLMKNLPQLKTLAEVCARVFQANALQSTRARSNGKRVASAPSPDYAHEDGSLDSESGSLP